MAHRQPERALQRLARDQVVQGANRSGVGQEDGIRVVQFGQERTQTI